jgi:hypothetical protein
VSTVALARSSALADLRCSNLVARLIGLSSPLSGVYRNRLEGADANYQVEQIFAVVTSSLQIRAYEFRSVAISCVTIN